MRAAMPSCFSLRSMTAWARAASLAAARSRLPLASSSALAWFLSLRSCAAFCLLTAPPGRGPSRCGLGSVFLVSGFAVGVEGNSDVEVASSFHSWSRQVKAAPPPHLPHLQKKANRIIFSPMRGLPPAQQTQVNQRQKKTHTHTQNPKSSSSKMRCPCVHQTTGTCHDQQPAFTTVTSAIVKTTTLYTTLTSSEDGRNSGQHRQPLHHLQPHRPDRHRAVVRLSASRHRR